MTTPAKLSDKLYRWTKPDGGHAIGRKVYGTYCAASDLYLVRCDFGHLYWVDADELIEHDTSYRQREKEADLPHAVGVPADVQIQATGKGRTYT